jgi:hypothetical protein
VVEPATAIVEGETAILVGNGSGVPLKIDAGGKVVAADAATGHFRASVDNFGGGSGGGVFDDAGRLLGVAVTGAADYDVTPEGCRKARALDESQGMESVTYAARAVDGLCAVSPRADLCDAARPSCGIGRLRSGASPEPLVAVLVLLLCGRLLRWRRRGPAQEMAQRNARGTTMSHRGCLPAGRSVVYRRL